MRVESLLNKVKRCVENFTVTEETVFHVIELNERWTEARTKCEGIEDGSMFLEQAAEWHRCYIDIIDYLSLLSDKELQELCCLMQFGRYLSSGSFSEEVAQDLVERVENKTYYYITGRFGAACIAKHASLGEWLRHAMTLIKKGSGSYTFYRLTIYRKNGLSTSMEFNDSSSAWKAYSSMIAPPLDPEGVYDVMLVACSTAGCAETSLAFTCFEL